MKRILLASVAALALSGCGDDAEPRTRPAGPGYAGSPIAVGGLKVPVRAREGALELAVGGRFSPRFWPGVNLGATLPGTFPGELAPARRDYDRWLAGMGELGVRLLRVYTILPPQFYAALAAHNEAHATRPIHLLQGVWIPEQEFLAGRDAYPLLDDWKRELSDAVEVVHGDASLPRRRGRASGRYTADVSAWPRSRRAAAGAARSRSRTG
jgi:hypothetical protein